MLAAAQPRDNDPSRLLHTYLQLSNVTYSHNTAGMAGASAATAYGGGLATLDCTYLATVGTGWVGAFGLVGLPHATSKEHPNHGKSWQSRTVLPPGRCTIGTVCLRSSMHSPVSPLSACSVGVSLSRMSRWKMTCMAQGFIQVSRSRVAQSNVLPRRHPTGPLLALPRI